LIYGNGQDAFDTQWVWEVEWLRGAIA
jgi:hypothetical protein